MVEQIRIIMKAQFLKIAKCKTDKEFYKKYPTEAAFFKAHPEAKQHIKKAQSGLNTVDKNRNGIPDLLENIQPVTSQAPFGPQNNWNFGNPNFNAGAIPAAPSMNQIASNAMQKKDSFAMPNQAQEFMKETSAASQKMLEGATKGGFGSKAFGSGAPKSLGDKVMPYVGAATDVFGGIKGLGPQQDEVDKWKQMREVSKLQALASGTREEEYKRMYDREDIMQANQFSVPGGVGTNPLARNGKFIRKAQDGLDAIESNDSYGLKQEEPTQVRGNSEDYASTRGYDNSMYTEVPVQETVTPTFDSKSARDNWVQKTGLPWSEAKRLG